MRVIRWIWTVICTGFALAGALAYGLPVTHDYYIGFGVYAAVVFCTVLVFAWLPGVIALFSIDLLVHGYRRVRRQPGVARDPSSGS